MSVAGNSDRRERGIATIIFAAATLFSRFAGVLRQMVVAAIFGASTTLSAFTVAVQIPNLIRALVADAALSGAFVPVFTDLDEKGERDKAWALASSLITLVLVVLGPICVLVAVAAPYVVAPLIDEKAFGAEAVDLTVKLTRILMPIVVLMAASSVVTGILNSYGHFTVPALAPVAWNFVILAGLLAIAPFVGKEAKIFVYTGAVLAGTVVQAVLPVPWLRGRGGRLRLGRLSLADANLRHVLILMLPVTLSLGLINLQQLIDITFSSHVPAHLMTPGVDKGAGPAILDNAFRIYMLPQGLFAVAIATVFFPSLARHAARKDMDAYRETFADAIRQVLILMVPSSVFLVVLAQPVTKLLYQHGEFTAADTTAVSQALMMYSFGIVLNGVALVLIRSFFAIQRTWIPTITSVMVLVVNILLDFILYDTMGIPGIALATTLVNMCAVVVMLLFMRSAAGVRGGKVMLVSLLGSLVVSILVCVPARVLNTLINDSGLSGYVSQNGAELIAMICACLVAVGGYLFIMHIAGFANLHQIMAVMRRRQVATEQGGSEE